jgi:hypothetical protein
MARRRQINRIALEDIRTWEKWMPVMCNPIPMRAYRRAENGLAGLS